MTGIIERKGNRIHARIWLKTTVRSWEKVKFNNCSISKETSYYFYYVKKKIDPLFTTCFPIFLVSFCSIIPWKSCLYLLLRFLLPYSVKPIPIRPLHHSELRQFLSFSSNFHVARCHMLLSLFILLDLSATFDRAISLNLETLSSLLCRITHTPGYLLPQCWLLVILLCLSLHRLSIGEPQSSGLVFCVSHNSLH